jgi:hypothetical protein
VANRVVDVNLVEHGAVVQGDGQGVADEALLGVVVLGRERLVFDTGDLRVRQEETGRCQYL